MNWIIGGCSCPANVGTVSGSAQTSLPFSVAWTGTIPATTTGVCSWTLYFVSIQKRKNQVLKSLNVEVLVGQEEAVLSVRMWSGRQDHVETSHLWCTDREMWFYDLDDFRYKNKVMMNASSASLFHIQVSKWRECELGPAEWWASPAKKSSIYIIKCCSLRQADAKSIAEVLMQVWLQLVHTRGNVSRY